MTYEEALRRLESDDHLFFYFQGKGKLHEAFDIARIALEKQIPKKPVGRYTDYKCPVCGRRVRSGKGSSSRGVDHFCQRCGQQLDWSDTE